jgi:hypothetical protein
MADGPYLIDEERGSRADQRWVWSLFSILANPPGMRTDGHAPTVNAAKAEFEANWRRWRNLVERRAIIVRTRPCRNHSVCYALSSARRAVDCICVGSTAPLGRHGLDNGEIELLRQLDSVVRAEPGSERQAPNEDAALQPTSNGR